MTDKDFQKEIYRYFKASGRVLPWRVPSVKINKDGSVDPYKIMVSEIMLQQTQALRVAPKFEAFLKAFPNAKALAAATNTEVLALWSGLGYNRRAINLKRAAEVVVSDHKGVFPRAKEELLELPGIGPYTAGAISAFAFNQPEIFIETNIRTVYIHFFFPEQEIVHDQELMPIIKRTLDRKSPRTWYAALMDYGAMLKATTTNPSRKSKQYSKQSAFTGSVREVRGAILKLLLDKKKANQKELQGVFDDERFLKAIAGLTKDGLISKKGNYFTIS